MHETPSGFYNLESPAPGATLSAGQHSLRGWLMPKPGAHFVDVRGRVAGRLFAGGYGLPRADLAAVFKTGRPYALAEFQVAVELSPGPTEIILEALEITGNWSEFARAHYRVMPASPPVDFAVPSGPLRWHDFCRSLDLILRAKRSQPNAPWLELAQKIARELPYPRDLRVPETPFIGFVDEPALVNCRHFGQIPVIGHVFHTSARILKIKASSDLQVLQTLGYNRSTPSVAACYPQQPTAAACGFLGFVDVPAQLPNPATIHIYAEMADQSLHLVHTLRTRLHDAEEEKLAYAPAGPRAFDEALAAWRQTLEARAIPVLVDADFQPGLDRLRASYTKQTARPSVENGIPPAHLAPARTPADRTPRHALLVSHNLNLEGAPLFLLDYAGDLITRGVEVTMLCPSDGPLRTRFESIGARIRLVDLSGIFAAQSPDAARDAIRALGRTHDFAAFDLVVANTFTSFWGVHAAKQAGRPSLLYVHESTTPANFYLTRVQPWIVSLAEEAFSLADAVSFTTASTRKYHLDYGRPANHWLVPGWIDVARIDAWLTQHPRDGLRARFGLRSGELLVTNIGTVCERKGQHIFIRAVDLLWRRHPELAARARFVMLGGGRTPFDDAIADLLAQVARSNLIVHPATADYFPYYAAADLFVCSTFEESSPRVILEAMAFGTPILSSNVQGIPEQVRADREALLVPAGDTVALCEAMRVMLLNPALGLAQAARARERVLTEFSAAAILPRHLALAAAVVAGRS